MDTKWVKIRSWHAVRLTRSASYVMTLCGRHVPNAVIVDDLPAEKSCETCLRILARREDG